MKTQFIIACILIGLALAAITLFFVDKFYQKPCITTCSNDEQCGGVVIGEKFCREDGIYTYGQKNTCTNAGTCNAMCKTAYEILLVEKCEKGCIAEKCL